MILYKIYNFLLCRFDNLFILDKDFKLNAIGFSQKFF